MRKLMDALSYIGAVSKDQLDEIAQLVTKIGLSCDSIAAWQSGFYKGYQASHFHHYADRIPPKIKSLIPEKLLKPIPQPTQKRTMSQMDDVVSDPKKLRSDKPDISATKNPTEISTDDFFNDSYFYSSGISPPLAYSEILSFGTEEDPSKIPLKEPDCASLSRAENLPELQDSSEDRCSGRFFS
jgi:hypothetical protein